MRVQEIPILYHSRISSINGILQNCVGLFGPCAWVISGGSLGSPIVEFSNPDLAGWSLKPVGVGVLGDQWSL